MSMSRPKLLQFARVKLKQLLGVSPLLWKTMSFSGKNTGIFVFTAAGTRYWTSRVLVPTPVLHSQFCIVNDTIELKKRWKWISNSQQKASNLNLRNPQDVVLVDFLWMSFHSLTALLFIQIKTNRECIMLLVSAFLFFFLLTDSSVKFVETVNRGEWYFYIMPDCGMG